jgi:hypothetical protein
MATVNQKRDGFKVLFDSNDQVIGQKDSSVVVITDFAQASKNKKLENVVENDSIQIVVGVNKFNKGEKHLRRIDPILSGAGILVNEAISPSYVFNPSRKEDGLVLEQPNKESSEYLKNSQKGVSTVTLFADEIQLVSFMNGVNIHTTPRATAKTRGLPQLSSGVGVSLIHGNDVKNLQKMVKGDKLQKTIIEMQGIMSQANYNIFSLRNLIFAFLGIFAAHTHITTFPGVPTIPSIEGALYSAFAFPVGIKQQIDNVITEINNVITITNQSTAFDNNYLSAHHKLN